MLLDISSTCKDAALVNLLSGVQRIILLIQIIVPILLLVWGSWGMFNLVKNPDEKNGVKNIINKFVAAIIVFFIPVFVNVMFNVMGYNTQISSCWNDAESLSSKGSPTYVNPAGKEEKPSVVGNTQEYQKGKQKSKNNSSSSNNNINSNNNSSSSSSSSSSNGGSGNRVIFLGDSRTVQMYAYLTGNWSSPNYSDGGAHTVGNDVFIAQGAMGLDWMQSTGIPAAINYFGSGTSLVILMGVNDTYNADNYISYLNSNASNWSATGTKIYFSAVAPCNNNYNNHNNSVVSFNSKLKSGLANNIKWIDTYNYLVSSGFTTTDGLHYSADTSNKIYNYIKSNV